MCPHTNCIPCPNICTLDCPIRAKMEDLNRNLELVGTGCITDLIDQFLITYGELSNSEATTPPPTIALPALFDFLVSAEYARMVADAGWTYCSGQGTQEGPKLYFPYLKACPRCSVKRNLRSSAISNKPGSDYIGEISGKITAAIFSRILNVTVPDAKIARSTERQGDVDLVICSGDLIVLGEIKSSPLAVYPLEVSLPSTLTVMVEGNVIPLADHSPATSLISSSNIAMYLPQIDLSIPLGPKSDDSWPYPKLQMFVESQDNVKKLIEGWKVLYDTYANRGRNNGSINPHRWITCGCGGSVDDSKNAPGVDRTDDIKKGTYQVLKYGTYFKEKCPKTAIRAVLASNFYPLHTLERYFSEMEDVVWTKDKYSIEPSSLGISNNVKIYDKDFVFNLYDAVICLTNSEFADGDIKRMFDMGVFWERIRNG